MIDDAERFCSILPDWVRDSIPPASESLMEVVLDVGRPAVIRYQDHLVRVDQKVTYEDLDAVVALLGGFGDDDRACVNGALHRISCIRNRAGRIIGLTCRMGRHVPDAINGLEELLDSGQSILLVGPCASGKTTLLRAAAAHLSKEKPVVVVDTSNEIAGDGDIPHAAIGNARRMQVSLTCQQHVVMQRAIENHTPQVVIVDEIGNVQEAAAARTIAERGAQLIATAHGTCLQDVIKNPELQDLVGGVQSVILGDAEAKRRGTQKTASERKSAPTFQVIIEIQDREHYLIHRDAAASVDAILREKDVSTCSLTRGETIREPAKSSPSSAQAITIFPYGINRDQVAQATRHLEERFHIVRRPESASHILTTKKRLEGHDAMLDHAQKQGTSILAIRSNTYAQIVRVVEKALESAAC